MFSHCFSGHFLKNLTSWSRWLPVVTIPTRNAIVRMTSWMRSSCYVSINHVTNHVSKCWKTTTDNCSNSWRNWSSCLNRYWELNFLAAPYHPSGLKIRFEEPSGDISDHIEFGWDIRMMMSDDHEFSVAWKTNINEKKLYQYNHGIMYLFWTVNDVHYCDRLP